MGTLTEIAWTDHTFNPWMGCTHVHAGCTNCYAESFAKRYNKATWGPGGSRVLTSVSNWKKPLKWNEVAEGLGQRRKVFCASLADVFEDWQGPMGGDSRCIETMDEAREHLFQLIDATPWLDWQLLTKRPENIRRMWPGMQSVVGPAGAEFVYRKNVWIGTSVSEPNSINQIRHLLRVRELSPVLFVSAEPLLSRVDFSDVHCEAGWRVDALRGEWEEIHYGNHEEQTELECHSDGPKLDWVIVGGESGGKRRDCGVDAIMSVVRQCQDADVACFVKQDCAMHSGQQGRIPDDVWAVKEFPVFVEDM